MNISFQSVSLYGPTIHSNFKILPFPQSSPMSSEPCLIDKPLLCLQTASCMKIVGNIHLFEIGQETGVLSKPAFIINDIEKTVDLIKTVAEFYSPLNLIEEARLVLIAQQLGYSPAQLAIEILPVLNYPPQKKFVEKLLELNKLPEALQLFIVEKNISLKRTQVLQRIENHSDWAKYFLETYTPGLNVFLEIIQNLWEISKRDDIAIHELLQKYIPLHAIPDSTHIKIELQTIRQRIHENRYPLLSDSRRKLETAIKDIQKYYPIKIDYDPNFEVQGVNILTHINDNDALKSFINCLEHDDFRKLFEMI